MKFSLPTAGAAVLLLLLDAARALPTDDARLSVHMATSIMARRQGIMTGGGGVSEALQAGFAQKAFAALARQYPNDGRTAAVRDYIRESAASVAPFLTNASRDALAYPLDRLSNGNALLALSVGPETNETRQFRAAAKALRESIDLNPRNSEGGLWYFVYPNWSYLDGMYSLAPFYTLYTTTMGAEGSDADAVKALDDMNHQLRLLWAHTRNASTGLLVHGYDDSRTAVWADPVTGASPHVWGRSLGWFAMALVDTLELLPKSAGKVRDSLLYMYRDLAAAVVAAADPPTGGWWQVLDRPGAERNYIESSGTAMFTYALLKGARLGYLADVSVAATASSIGARAQKYLSDTFVVRNANGTLGYNGTVAVCSLNSSASYESSRFLQLLVQLSALVRPFLVFPLAIMSNPIKQAAESARSKMSKPSESVAAVRNDFLHTPVMQAALPFLNGGASGMVATTVIQPIDMIKVRLQLAGEGVATGPKPTPISVTKEILAQGKVLDLYTGLSAGLLRQAVYTTARLGFFDTFMKNLAKRAEEKGTQVGFGERAGAGLAAGGIAAFVGNPADLALVRMQSDGLKPLAERQNYKSVVDALSHIVRSEGVRALWAGATPTVVRAMSLNLGQLACFSEAKQQLKTHTNWSARTQTLTASAIAGFFASFLSLPFDFVKTRLQKQQKGPDGKVPYKGMVDCFKKVTAQEGLLRFYRGFGTYYVRIAPHAMVTLIVVDYLGWLTK